MKQNYSFYFVRNHHYSNRRIADSRDLELPTHSGNSDSAKQKYIRISGQALNHRLIWQHIAELGDIPLTARRGHQAFPETDLQAPQ
jgi:hypothetical protein